MKLNLTSEESEIIFVSKQYVNAFKDLNPDLIDQFFTHDFSKVGFFFDHNKQEWLTKSLDTFDEVKKWTLGYNEENIISDKEPIVQVIDMQERIAVAKVEFEWAPNDWGYDYVLLIKEEETWKIQNIIWQTKRG